MLKIKIQEKFEKILVVICGRSIAFWIFPPYGLMLRKTNKFIKIQDLKMWDLWRYWRQKLGGVWENWAAICGRSRILQFWLP